MTMEQPLLFQLNGRVGTVTFNRPKELNAVNLDMARAMGELARKLPGVEDMKAIVLRGSGNHFMAGGDINVFHGEKNKILPVISEIIDHFHAFIFCLQNLPQPVISAVRGAAAGGGFSLAISADIIIADETAKFTPAYRKLGTTPDGGGSFFLPRIVGPKKAMEMFLAGGTYSARDTKDLGLINSVVAASELDNEVERMATTLIMNSAAVAAATKHLLKGNELDALRSHLEAEKASFLSFASGSDFTEGVDAFMTKRAPIFTG